MGDLSWLLYQGVYESLDTAGGHILETGDSV